ncbi:glycoside hydrolase family 5 protein [Flaviflagellibacter deserti]
MSLLNTPSGAGQLQGVNLSGAEFKDIKQTSTTATPFGRLNKDYAWPDPLVLKGWQDRGVTVVRLPFRWERVQPDLRGDVSLDHIAKLVEVASRGTTVVILDMHNYGNRWVSTPDGVKQAQIDGPSGLVTRDDYADVWRKIAERFKDYPLVQFDLMNEPHDLKSADAATEAEILRRMYQAAIDAIRGAGATNSIHIEPPNWAKSGALVSSFSDAALSLRDPADNLIFQVHQYVDKGEKGILPDAANGDVDAGRRKIEAATEWARKHRKILFLGEFGIPNASSSSGLTAASRMIDHVQGNPDVWLGWTAWGGGKAWREDYVFRLESTPPVDPAGRLLLFEKLHSK